MDNIEVQAAQAAIDTNNRKLRLELENGDSVDLYHMLRSLLDWCDARSVDFDATVSEVRADMA